MPVRMPVAEQDSVGPYNRMSASQANTYEACPRLWFYQKVYRFKMPQIPVLFVGRAVEEAVCRVLENLPVSWWHRRVQRHWKHPLTRMTERQYRPPNAHGLQAA